MNFKVKTKNNMKKFKALMYGDIFVDIVFLEKGIYGTDRPTLYSLDTTLEELARRKRDINKHFSDLYSEEYFDNLSQCQLVEVELVVCK